MVRIIMITAALLLSVLGLCEIVHIACVIVLRPPKKAEKILVLFPKKDNAEEQIMLTLHEISWHGENYAEKVAVITEDMNFEEKRVCAERFSGKPIIFAENLEEFGKIYKRF
ncbi:MAG: hypothetical protein KBS52_00700 [Clostridiales bacterium]|nr:hypothetical protein [Candidatus Equinaster intestinalis]